MVQGHTWIWDSAFQSICIPKRNHVTSLFMPELFCISCTLISFVNRRKSSPVTKRQTKRNPCSSRSHNAIDPPIYIFSSVPYHISAKKHQLWHDAWPADLMTSIIRHHIFADVDLTLLKRFPVQIPNLPHVRLATPIWQQTGPVLTWKYLAGRHDWLFHLDLTLNIRILINYLRLACQWFHLCFPFLLCRPSATRKLTIVYPS